MLTTGQLGFPKAALPCGGCSCVQREAHWGAKLGTADSILLPDPALCMHACFAKGKTFKHKEVKGYLGIDVHQRKGNPEENTAAAFQEEDVPHPKAAFQRQAVDKDAEEPVGADTGHIHTMALQVTAQAGEALIYQLLEHQLVHLHASCGNAIAWGSLQCTACLLDSFYTQLVPFLIFLIPWLH